MVPREAPTWGPETLCEVRRFLRERGVYDGPLDANFGSRTHAAPVAYARLNRPAPERACLLRTLRILLPLALMALVPEGSSALTQTRRALVTGIDEAGHVAPPQKAQDDARVAGRRFEKLEFRVTPALDRDRRRFNQVHTPSL